MLKPGPKLQAAQHPDYLLSILIPPILPPSLRAVNPEYGRRNNARSRLRPKVWGGIPATGSPPKNAANVYREKLMASIRPGSGAIASEGSRASGLRNGPSNPHRRSWHVWAALRVGTMEPSSFPDHRLAGC